MQKRSSSSETASQRDEPLLHENLVRVFGERNRERRQAAIAEIYAPDAVLYEPDASATGHQAINEAVEALLANLPPAFVFTAQGPAIGHHGIARLHWASGPPNGPAAVTGTECGARRGRPHSEPLRIARSGGRLSLPLNQ
jgi:hypothetical protein